MVTYMKKTIKYIALTVLLISYFVFEPVKRSLDFELNLMGINYIFMRVLHSLTYILWYFIINNRLDAAKYVPI